MKMDITEFKKNARLKIRKRYNLPSNIYVEVIKGNSKPQLIGTGWHYKTKGGDVIHSPSAYSRLGFSNMVYCSSTQRIVVGRYWKP